MTAEDDQDEDLERLMRAEGVIPLRGAGGRRRALASAPRRPAGAAAPAPVTSARTASNGPSVTSSARPAAVSPAPAAAVNAPQLEAVEEAARQAQAQVQSLTEQLRQARQRAGQLAQQNDALRRQLQPDRDGGPSGSLRGLLAARGLDATEVPDLLLWAAEHDADGLLGRFLDGPAAARDWLEERVDLLCGEASCPARPGTLRIRVPATRCDHCGGSEIQRAGQGFFEACVAGGLVRVCVVGGSPAYREQLQALMVRDGRVKLDLVSGLKKIDRKRAAARVSGSDLVIVWGATLLHHAVSENFDRSARHVVIVAHRGIGGMLREATAHARRLAEG